MDIGIVGGGYSGVLSALLIKKKIPDANILIFEKNNQIGKKIKATGNGKCNIDNVLDDESKYNEPDFIKALMDEFDVETQIEALKEIGIFTKDLGHGGIYPYSESANNVVSILEQQLEALDIKVYLETIVKDYLKKDGRYIVITDKADFKVDKLIIAPGGMSTPNLGSDGNFVEIIKKHGYQFKDYQPGLCPIKVSDHVKLLFGERVKANVRVLVSGKLIFEEFGEVNFKKDGLSGIVMMNAASAIARRHLHGAMISLTIPHDLDEEKLINLSHSLKNPLITIVNENLANYIYVRSKVERHFDLDDYEASKIIDTLSHLRFRFESLYDFKDSQVSVGGILLDEINPDFSSKREKGVYFAGETVNIDGMCGGFNMKYCLLSALKIANSINE